MIKNVFSNLILLQSEQAWLLASEKVYSVLTVVLIIFVVFIGYLIFTNKKVSDLEKKLEE